MAQSRSPSLIPTVIWIGCSMPCARPVASTNPTARSMRAQRVVLEPEGQREVEERLGVRRPDDVVEQRGLDRQQQFAAHRLEAGDHAVVDEQPAPLAKRVAVGLLHRRPGRRADVREEQRRLDVAARSRRLTSLQAGVMLRYRPGRPPLVPYQPSPKPSPLVVSTPIRACRLWSIRPWSVLNSSSSIASPADRSTHSSGTCSSGGAQLLGEELRAPCASSWSARRPS